MSHEPVGREEVLGALEHTLARRVARIEFRLEMDFDFDMAASWTPPIRLGSLALRVLRRPSRRSLESLVRGIGRLFMRWAGKLAALAMGRLAKRWMGKLGAQRAVGVIDFDAHRCMYGYRGRRSEATLVAGDKYWHGEPGTSVDAASEKPAPATQPLWLLDLVRGVAEAHVSGEELLDGHTCRRFVGHADLNRAAAAVPYEMAVPPGMDQLGQLTRIPVELWIDPERQIRRICQNSGERPNAPKTTSTVDLIELGVGPPPDWSRLDIPATDARTRRPGTHKPARAS
jgi:hypothetical protein